MSMQTLTRDVDAAAAVAVHNSDAEKSRTFYASDDTKINDFDEDVLILDAIFL